MNRSEIFNTFFFVVLSLLTISFVLPIAFNSILIIILFIVLLVDYRNFWNTLTAYINNKKNILLLVIFFCILLSFFYSDDKETAKKAIISALPLIIVPLSLAGDTTLSKKRIQFLKKLFVYACLVSSIVYLLLAIKRSGMLDGSYKLVHAPENFYAYFISQLTYNHLSPSIHAIFYSLYIALAILIIVYDFQKISLKEKILCGVLAFYFLVYLLLLISIIINFALYSFLILNFYFKSSFKKWWHYCVFFGGIAFGTATTAYITTIKYFGPYGDGTYRFDSPSINQKLLLALAAVFLIGIIAIIIKRIFQKKYISVLIGALIIAAISSVIYFQFNKNKIGDLKKNSISIRIKYGDAAVNIIKAHPFIGIGIGDKKNKWIMRSEDLPPGAAPEHVFNSHNQFLDFWVAAGIIPFICFVLFLINQLRSAWRSRHIVYLGLVYCFCLFCLTDSAMMVQRGQVFFLFFVWLFELDSKRKEEQNFLN